jgi:hypothetical protein
MQKALSNQTPTEFVRQHSSAIRHQPFTMINRKIKSISNQPIQSSRKGLKRIIKPHNFSHTIDEPRTRMNPTQQPRVRFETDLNEILKTGPVTENPQSSTLN